MLIGDAGALSFGVDADLLLLLLPGLLLLSEVFDLLDHSPLRGVRVVPIVGLQLGDLVQGILSRVTLLLDVGHESGLVHRIELLLNLLFYNIDKRREEL